MTLPLPKAGTGLMTIAFDLDGTLAEATWPKPYIGDPLDAGVDALIQYSKKGYEIVIFTSRPASHKQKIGDWLERVGIRNLVYDIITDKPRYAMFVDDRAVTFPEAFEDIASRERSAREVHRMYQDAMDQRGAEEFEAGVKYGRRKALEESANGVAVNHWLHGAGGGHQHQHEHTLRPGEFRPDHEHA